MAAPREIKEIHKVTKSTSLTADKASAYENMSPATIYAFLTLKFEACPRSPQNEKITPFHGKAPPSLWIGGYFIRIVNYLNLPVEVMIIGLSLMYRLTAQTKASNEVPINQLTIHRVFAACFLVAYKLDSESKFYYKNSYWAKVCGLSPKELMNLEIEVLKRLEFNLQVSSEEYYQTRVAVLKDITVRPARAQELYHAFHFIIDEPKNSPPAMPNPQAKPSFFRSCLQKCSHKRKRIEKDDANPTKQPRL